MSSEHRAFLGLAELYLRPYGSGVPASLVGDLSELKISQSQDTKKIPGKSILSGGADVKTYTQVSDVSVQFTLTSWHLDNLKLALGATEIDQAGGTVTDESLVAGYGLVMLKHKGAKSVVLTSSDGSTTYEEGKDYTVMPSGLLIHKGGAINEADNLLADYEHPPKQVLQGLVTKGKQWEMLIDGINRAETDDQYSVHLFKVDIPPVSDLDLLTDDFGSLTLTGTVLSTGLGKAESDHYTYTKIG
ncbi:phage tail tube protein [Aliamphritea hakodatensis]|uniref:phage tail tube protein n=1 Tax=Aliamphritea hakodatensis TaxID=2895352 RepID=UPI0022FDAF40|nr:hypothetical protein [Aliamphritea hakodatensis]